MAQNRRVAYDDDAIVVLGDKIYLRSQKRDPFEVYEKHTLKKIEIEKISNSKLQWQKPMVEDRSLEFSPLMTDGKYIYVISVRKNCLQSEEEYYDDMSKYVEFQYVVEGYDPSDNYKSVKQVILRKQNKNGAFYKAKNMKPGQWLREQMWATNGEYLLCFSDDGRLRYFSLQSGKVFKKQRTNFDSADHVLKGSGSNLFINISAQECKTFVVENFTYDEKLKESVEEMGKILAVLDEKKEKVTDKVVEDNLLDSIMFGGAEVTSE